MAAELGFTYLWYPPFQAAALEGSMPYPMQEQPPLLASVVERFLDE